MSPNRINIEVNFFNVFIVVLFKLEKYACMFLVYNDYNYITRVVSLWEAKERLF